MNFWAGDKIATDKIRDIAAYNRANARMWCVYGALWVLAGVAALFSAPAAGFLCILLGFFGIFALLYCYHRIYRKYKR